jgi:hypothetical protein
MKPKSKSYKALVLLWSSQHERYIQPGEVIELDLPAQGIKRLVEMGAIELYTQPVRETAEVDNG